MRCSALVLDVTVCAVRAQAALDFAFVPIPLKRSYGYAFDAGRPARHPFGANAAHCSNSLQAHSSADQPNCFAHHALIPKPFMQFAG